MTEASWQLGHFSNRLKAHDYRMLPRPKGIGGRWTVRVIVPMGDGIVTVQHTKDDESYWVFPGGRIERYETIPSAGNREVLEETHLTVATIRLLYVRDFYNNNDIEFYVVANYVSGDLTLGYDPEIGVELLSDVRIMSFDDLEHNDELTFYPITLRKRLRRDLELPPTKALYLGHVL